MEAGFLNFHDEEHFSDFSLSLGQHDSLEESQSSLMAIVDSDFDYVQYAHGDASHIDTSGGLWGDEQELNGDRAVLPESGVASVIPKIENMKEDFAKVLTDWQEHIGYLEFDFQASDMEEDIDMCHLGMNVPEKMETDLPDDIFQQDDSAHSSPSKSSTKMEFDEPISVKGEPQISDLNNELIDSDNASFELFSLTTNNHDSMNELPKLLSSPGKIFDATPVKRKNIKIELEQNEIVDTIEKEKPKSSHVANIKMEPEDCIDVETVPEHAPVLEAGDVKSLLEQFEASEAKFQPEPEKKSSKNLRVSMKKRPAIDQSKQTLIKKSINSQASKLHKNIRDSLPKEVVDRIKASGRSKVISVIPALSNPKCGSRSNGSRNQGAATTSSKNKSTKVITKNTNSSTRMDESVQLDHDYCSNTKSRNSVKKTEKHNTTKKSDNATTNVNDVARSGIRKDIARSADKWSDNNSKKDSGLESGDVSDASEEHATALNPKSLKNEPAKTQNNSKQQQQQQDKIETPTVHNQVNSVNDMKPKPVYEMKIQSALATSILQLRKGVITKTKPVDTGHKGKQMISVLKRPPVSSTSLLSSNPNESIITTKNSSNDDVQNIIVQDVNQLETLSESEKKPPRRKLNLAEYRTRREQTRSDNSRTCSPVQPMMLVYIHHASTTTEPIEDHPNNPVWSEREIVSVLKPKAELEDDKFRVKPEVRSIAIQTNETVFENHQNIEEIPDDKSVECIGEVKEVRINRLNERKERNYRHRKSSRSSSRSRSPDGDRRIRSRTRRRSRSSSRSISRSRSSSDRSKSRSRSRSRSRRHNRRHRTISHRRSSVSSDSSWSSRSRSRSRSRSSYRSRSRSIPRSRSRSRSRSSRSRSRSSRSSRSSSRYSSCSRSSTNFGRKWPRDRRRNGHRESRTRYDKRRRCSSGSSYGSRYSRRSSRYGRSADPWHNQEKKRQVEERRVIYVGRLSEDIKKADLRRRFEAFGPVLDISLHFREHGDNYGFVTFAYKNDAYQAVEHGNDDPSFPRYDLCFGGRRAFCKVKYADLDGMASSSLDRGEFPPSRSMVKKDDEDNSFDLLLKQAKAKLRKRKV